MSLTAVALAVSVLGVGCGKETMQVYDQVAGTRIVQAVAMAEQRDVAKLHELTLDAHRRVDGNSNFAPPAAGNSSSKEARRRTTFEGFGDSTVLLIENSASTNSAERVGGKPYDAWFSQLAAEEQKAIASRFDGYVSVLLDNVQTDVSQEEALASSFERFIRGVDDFQPLIGGKTIDEHQDIASARLAEMRSEAAREQALQAKARASVSDRTSQNLYAQDTTFHARRDTRDQLRQTDQRDLAPLVTNAQNYRAHLENALREWNNKARYESTADSEYREAGWQWALANSHRYDTDRRYEAVDEVCEQPWDEATQTLGPEECETIYDWVEYEVDNSAPYEWAARAAESRAREAESDARSAGYAADRSADQAADSLGTFAGNLQTALNSEALARFELRNQLPTEPYRSSRGGPGSTYSSISSELLNYERSPFLASVEKANSAMRQKIKTEADWVDGEIATRIAKEAQQARTTPPTASPASSSFPVASK